MEFDEGQSVPAANGKSSTLGRVLVVDDDKNIRLLFRQHLRNAGYRVNICQDAVSALRILELREMDVVITDILLPDMAGTTLLSTLRSRFPYMKVILITGEPNIDSAAQAVRGGAFDYLPKPIKKDHIIRSVDRAMRMKQLDDENRRLQLENKRYQEHLEELVAERTTELAVLSRRIISIQEEERSRLSRELHDDLGQSLLALKLNLQSVFGRLGKMDDSNQKDVHWCMDYLNEIINKSRRISHNLSPVSLENLGLIRAIRDLTENLNPDRKIKIRLHINDLQNYFTGNWDINVYRFIQEALTNIVKHAKASHVEVYAVRTDDEGIMISVHDDGVGIPEEVLTEGNDLEKGLGLQIMKKRVDLLGGNFIINTKKNNGTEVRIELPGKPLPNSAG